MKKKILSLCLMFFLHQNINTSAEDLYKKVNCLFKSKESKSCFKKLISFFTNFSEKIEFNNFRATKTNNEQPKFERIINWILNEKQRKFLTETIKIEGDNLSYYIQKAKNESIFDNYGSATLQNRIKLYFDIKQHFDKKLKSNKTNNNFFSSCFLNRKI